MEANGIFQSGIYYSQLALSAFFAILFLQSGLDKVINFRDNMSWLTSHFRKSILSALVPALVVIITISEMAAGLLSAAGFVQLLVFKSSSLALMGAMLSALSLLCLFFGQRIAKDYAGAGGLTGYFIISLAALLLLSC